MRSMRAASAFAMLFLISALGCSDTDTTGPDGDGSKWLDATEQVNGTLTTLGNIRVLKLHGTFYEIGYAHGYLLAPEIFERQELELSQSGVLEFFENEVLPNLDLFHIPDQYMEEIQGMYDGFLSRGGGSVYSDVLGREVTSDDAIALNCVSALSSRMQCSSFSAWGGMIHDSTSVTGYNHDTEDNERYTGRWLIITRKPAAGLGAYATVCVGRAGDMNVHTVMNEQGVTLSCQAVNDANPPTSSEGFTPEGLIFRQLVESAGRADPAGDISAVLNDIFATEAEALLMSWPGEGGAYSAAAVVELDGDLTVNHGFTIRQPGGSEEYIIQTNHFWLRQEPPEVQCDRYYHLKGVLDSVSTGTQPALTVESAWDLLSEIQLGDPYLTQIAVVFEPSKKLMHVAVADPGVHAHFCSRVTVDIEDILSE